MDSTVDRNQRAACHRARRAGVPVLVSQGDLLSVASLAGLLKRAPLLHPQRPAELTGAEAQVDEIVVNFACISWNESSTGEILQPAPDCFRAQAPLGELRLLVGSAHPATLEEAPPSRRKEPSPTLDALRAHLVDQWADIRLCAACRTESGLQGGGVARAVVVCWWAAP